MPALPRQVESGEHILDISPERKKTRYAKKRNSAVKDSSNSPASVTLPDPKQQPETNQSTECPLRMLNQYVPNVKFEVTEDGPQHDKVFIARVIVKNLEFTGEGKTLKKAKKIAAGKVFRTFTPRLSCDWSNDVSECVFHTLARSYPNRKFEVTGDGPAHARTFRAQGTHYRLKNSM